MRQRVGLVQRLRTAARPPKRRSTLSGAELEQDRDDGGHNDDDEASRLKATASRLLELLHQWLHSSKLRLLDVFRSHAMNARNNAGDAGHKGGSKDEGPDGSGGASDDVLDEHEAVALFAGAQSVTKFENVTEDDARALVRQQRAKFI